MSEKCLWYHFMDLCQPKTIHRGRQQNQSILPKIVLLFFGIFLAICDSVKNFGFFISLDFIKHKHLFFWRIFIFNIVLYYLTFSILDVVNSIKVPQVGVPSYAIQGKKAVLECPYILDGSEELYSVKWYKNGREFFR